MTHEVTGAHASRSGQIRTGLFVHSHGAATTAPLELIAAGSRLLRHVRSATGWDERADA